MVVGGRKRVALGEIPPQPSPPSSKRPRTRSQARAEQLTHGPTIDWRLVPPSSCHSSVSSSSLSSVSSASSSLSLFSLFGSGSSGPETRRETRRSSQQQQQQQQSRLDVGPSRSHKGRGGKELALAVAVEREEEEYEEEEESQVSALGCDEALEAAGHFAKQPEVVSDRLPPGITDIDDLGMSDDVTEFRVYAKQYYLHLRERESINQPKPDCLEVVQKREIKPKMRRVLVDWLIGVADEYKLMPSTLHLCVDLVDRSLSTAVVPRKYLQCLGCACLLIASKFEEVHPPRLEEIEYSTENSFTRRQILSMEKKVLNHLGFRVHSVNAYSFLPRFTRAACSKGREASLVYYLSELMLLDHSFYRYAPSLRAAAALNLARQTLARSSSKHGVWNATIEFYTGYSAAELEACVRDLHRAQVESAMEGPEADKASVVYQKYSRSNVVELLLDEDKLSFV